jgi:hypothetical protein
VKDAVAYGGGLEVLGHVTGSAVAVGGSIHLGPHAQVDGDAVAVGGSIQQEPGSRIQGERVEAGGGGIWRLFGKGLKFGTVSKSPDRRHVQVEMGHGSSGLWVLGFLIQFALFFAMGFLFVMFAPQRMKQVEEELRRDPVKCVLAGLVGLLAVFFLTVLLIVTLVGIPFAFFLLLVVAIAMAMGYSAVAMEIGTRLPFFRSRRTQAAVLAMGVAVVLLVGLIPVVGPLAITVAGLFSLGAIIRTRLGGGRKELPAPA